MTTDDDEELKEQRAQELREQQKILNILRHRLLLYERQRAILGDRTPPDVHIGIAGTETEIRLVEAKMRALRISPKVLEAVGAEGLFLEISAQIRDLASSQQTLNERQEATAEKVDVIVGRLEVIEPTVAEGAAWRVKETKERQEGQQAKQEEQARKARRERLMLLTLFAILVIVAISGGILLYVNR